MVSQVTVIKPSHYKSFRSLGRGGFGEVWQYEKLEKYPRPGHFSQRLETRERIDQIFGTWCDSKISRHWDFKVDQLWPDTSCNNSWDSEVHVTRYENRISGGYYTAYQNQYEVQWFRKDVSRKIQIDPLGLPTVLARVITIFTHVVRTYIPTFLYLAKWNDRYWWDCWSGQCDHCWQLLSYI